MGFCDAGFKKENQIYGFLLFLKIAKAWVYSSENPSAATSTVQGTSMLVVNIHAVHDIACYLVHCTCSLKNQ